MSSLSPQRLGTLALLGLIGVAGCAADDSDPAERRLATVPSSPTATQEEPVQQQEPARPNPQATRDLRRAVAAADVDAVRRAVADGADIEVRDRDRRTPLLLATRADQPAVARVLLDAGADPDAKDAIHDSAFLYAGAEGRTEILRMILEVGADVRSTNRYGGTALIPASEHAHVAVVRMLIDAGVPVNHVNDLSWTALHEAIVLGNGDADHVQVVRMLLEGGADQGIPDGDGVLPRTLAEQRGFTQIVAALDRY